MVALAVTAGVILTRPALGTVLAPYVTAVASTGQAIPSIAASRKPDSAALKSPDLDSHYVEVIAHAMQVSGVGEVPLLPFGVSRSKKSAKLLQGLLMSVLSRYADCWRMLYDGNTRKVLDNIPAAVNPESPFPQPVATPEQGLLLSELQQRRSSYRRYMRATAMALQTVFPKGRVWKNATVPTWVSQALEPFIHAPDGLAL